MKVRFNINYHTYWGQYLLIIGSSIELGQWEVEKAVYLDYKGDGIWSVEIEFEKSIKEISYKFLTFDENTKAKELEFGDNRTLSWGQNGLPFLNVKDTWRSNENATNSLYTSPFKNGLLATSKPKKKKISKTKNYQFNLRTAVVPKGHTVGIIGNKDSLGNWDLNKVIPMDKVGDNEWSTNITLSLKDFPANYKYVLLNGAIDNTRWEMDENRSLDFNAVVDKGEVSVVTDEYAKFPFNDWRGTGVAIPVFSIRSKKSTGVGEFSDIKGLVDWAEKTGIKMIQILPVNDTVANNTWVDSYPYAAISVFALHPLYINIWDAGELKDKKRKKYFETERTKLNDLTEVDYELVMKLKGLYLKELYVQEGKDVLNSKAFKSFFTSNEHWLPAYAMFCSLRDLNGSPNFQNWSSYQTINEKELTNYTRESSKHFEEVGYYYFIQFHLDQQLKSAVSYARKKSVVLKGDIPIGIYRNSVDAWVNPELYHMDSQAGAPPDDFSVSGQNWGFPTYNWERMAQDEYQWWKLRLQKMADYFDVFRIDHILGFFRIWEIPIDAVDGLLGHFNPSIPFTKHELKNRGIYFDYDRFCKPYIKEYVLEDVFNEHAHCIKQNYLDHLYDDSFQLKPDFNTQKKIKEHFDKLSENNPTEKANYEFLKFGLLRLVTEVIFLDAPNGNGEMFNPRISFHSTYSYNALDGYTKHNLDKLYTDYFYKRHNDFWQEKALQKLPALKSATDMLICGEDLGMVPDCVPGVMDSLKILSLAIQRMPNDSSKEFWHPSDTPYLSVCSTSSHDMSTIRGWWEEDTERTQRFYNQVLGRQGEAPVYCEPWIAYEIISQHLYSPSMWAIFPIQDFLAIDSELRRKSPAEERINVPANPQHYWRYRMHMNVEDLLDEKEFNDTLREIITSSGRNIVY